MTDQPETSSSHLSRRQLLMLVSIAAGSFATAVVSLPLIGFCSLLSSVKNPQSGAM